MRLRDKLRDEKPYIYRGELRHSFRSISLNAMMRSTSPLESRIRISSALRIIDCLILLQKDRLDAARLKTHPAISPIPLPFLRLPKGIGLKSNIRLSGGLRKLFLITSSDVSTHFRPVKNRLRGLNLR